MSMPIPVSQNINHFSMLQTYIKEIYDPRDPQKITYQLHEVIFIAIVALLSGANDWTGVENFGKARKRWLKKYFYLTCKIPSHDTFGRIFSLINPKEFSRAMLNWLNNLLSSPIIEVENDIINIDGKMIESYSAIDSFTLVRAWSTVTQSVLAQLKVPCGTNEIKTIPMLLELLLSINGKIITSDAIGAQKNIVELIVNKGANYAIVLKANQHQFYRDIKEFLDAIVDNEFDVPHTYYETFDNNHGRKETRRCWATQSLNWLEQKPLWKGLRSIIVVETTIEKKDKITINRRYFISSLPANAQRLLHIIRSHWSIENKLHWHLDVDFLEDKSTVKDRFSMQNLSLLRVLAISILGSFLPNLGFQRKRQFVNWHPSILKKILSK